VIGSLRFSIVAIALLSLVIAGAVRADEGAEPENKAAEKPAPQRVSAAVTDEDPLESRLIIPPYVRDRRGDVTTTAIFPLYFERKSDEGLQRFVLPYYYRRDRKFQADVALGLVWSLRGPDRNTFVLPPLYTHRSGKDWALGLLPLFATGTLAGHHHTVIPALLTWYDRREERHRLFVGPFYDVRLKSARWRGLFPIFWSKQDDSDSFAVVPPLFFRFAEQDPLEITTVVPPFYHIRRKDETGWGLVPLLFHKRSPKLKATTVPLALFHFARGPEELRLVTPLLAYFDDKREGTTWITPLYQRKRGDKNFDAVAPLFVRTWDKRDASRGLYLPPIYWHWEDPANRTTVVFPFYARSESDGLSDTWLTPVIGRTRNFEKKSDRWWLLPTFDWGSSEGASHFNLHPLFYRKRSAEQNHLAVAPFYFNFKNRKEQTHRFALSPLYWDFKDFKIQKRNRVLFPLYYDFANGKKQRHHRVVFPFYYDLDYRDRDARYRITFPFYANSKVGDRTRHFALNTMTERRADKDHSWQFHFFPLFSVGGSDKGKWWSVLYGLAGYDRRGDYRRVQAFWLPFDLDP
jgi:hypothetical protein